MSNCIECNKKLRYHKSKRCKQCYLKTLNGQGNPNFKNGIWLNPNICLCGSEIISKYAKLCRKCKDIEHSQKVSGEKSNFWGGGPTHPGYIHGKGYEDYPKEFNDTLKLKIRTRDNFQCQNCSMLEEEHLIVYGRVLQIHHIDYNKFNCKEDNLISTCCGCNTRANFNRSYWQETYTNKVNK